MARAEKILVWLLLSCFAIPSGAGLLLLLPRLRTTVPPWLLNQTLSGVQPKSEPVALSRASVFSARYQEGLTRQYGVRFVGREMLIRLTNELYLRSFHTAPAAGVVVGRGQSLFEKVYAEEYCLRRGDKNSLSPLVDDLRRMQDFCETRHTAFALVITPSKAAIYPEDLPAAWKSRYVQQPRYYDLLLPMLDEKKIRYVDGHRIAADLKRSANVPVFPLGGTHWGDPAALATTNALLDTLARQGLGVQSIREFTARNSVHPRSQDRDLCKLINIVSKWTYPVTTVTVQPTTSYDVSHPNMVIVGGSFTRRMLAMLDASRQFSEVDFYFYYKNSKKCWADGKMRAVGTPTPPINFETDVFAADALVLECNEETLPAPATHLTAFLRDAITKFPDEHAAKVPFHYESRLQP